MKSLLVSALAFLLGLASANAGNTLRFALTITGISEEPKPFPVESLGFSVTPVEIEDRFEPSAIRGGKANSVRFFLPEVEDEVIVAFLNWQRRIMNGQAKAHGADLVAYNFQGKPVQRWHLSNAWPSKIVAPTFSSTDQTPLDTTP